MIQLKVVGAREIDRILKELPKALSDSAIASANMAAAKPLVEREKLLAPEGPTGNLVDSIGAERAPKKSARVAGLVKVGPRRRGRYKGFAGHLVEFGTKRRETDSGANRGVMPKKPFAKPAFNMTKSTVERLIETSLSKSVVKVMKKYNTINAKAAAFG